jgi:hypothetical protein
MRDITITRRVFTFDELSPTAQDRAYGLLHADAWENIDNDMVSEYLAGKFVNMADGSEPNDGCYGGGLNKDQLKDRYDVNIYWSVSYSQGDGASIDGVISRDNHPNFEWPDGIHTIRVKTSNLGNSIITDLYGIDDDGGEGAHVSDPKLFDAANSLVRDICDTLYQAAVAECECYTSREYVTDTLDSYYDPRRFNDDGTYAPSDFWAAQ